MAIALASKTNVVAPGGAYPYGRIKNDTGAADGTPVDEQVYGDSHQFFAKLLDDGGVTPNGLSDNATNGFQYIEALKNLMGYSPWIDASGAFSASAPLGGTVSFPGGSVVYSRYRLIGKTLQWQLYLAGFTIGGLCPAIVINRPTASIGGYMNADFRLPTISNNSVAVEASLSSLSGPAQITLYPAGGGNFTAGTADRVMSINIVAEIT